MSLIHNITTNLFYYFIFLLTLLNTQVNQSKTANRASEVTFVL